MMSFDCSWLDMMMAAMFGLDCNYLFDFME